MDGWLPTMGCIGGGIRNAKAGVRSGFKKPFELKEAFITRDEMYDIFEDVTYAFGQGLMTLELQRILMKKIDGGLSADAYMAQVLRQHEAHIPGWFNGDFEADELPQTGDEILLKQIYFIDMYTSSFHCRILGAF